MQKLLTFFFSENISTYAIFNYQSCNDTLTNNIFSFEQLGPDLYQTAASLEEFDLGLNYLLSIVCPNIKGNYCISFES